MDDRSELWERLDGTLRRALDQLRDTLRPRDSELIADFIDNREYGVAHEWLSSAINESGSAVPAEAQAALAEAARLMNL